MAQELKELTLRGAKELQQCQACFKPAVSNDPNSEPIKLLVCSGCHYARYCSPERQRAHWRIHKPVCKSHQETLRKMEEAERTTYSDIRSSADPAFAPLPPTVLQEELLAFSKEMRSIFSYIAFVLLELSQYPDRWEDHLITMNLRRLFPMDTNVPTWARFEVTHILPLSHQDMMEIDERRAAQLLPQITSINRQNLSQHGKPTLSVYITAVQGLPESSRGPGVSTIVPIICPPVREMAEDIKSHLSQEESIQLLNKMMATIRDEAKTRSKTTTK